MEMCTCSKLLYYTADNATYIRTVYTHDSVVPVRWKGFGDRHLPERLSTRLLIVQRSQFVFVCMYVCMYVYPSHFNCVGTVSVVSSPDY